MPDDKKIVVNGIEMPLSEKAVKESGVDKSSNYSDILWSSGGKTPDEILKESEGLKQQIELQQKEKKYDDGISGTAKFVRGIIHQAAAALEDTIGAFDLGDWRIAETPGELIPYNKIFQFIDNTIGDGENEVGNYFTRRAAEVREYSSKVDNIDTGLESFDYLANGFKGLIGSASGFVLSGGGVSKLGQLGNLGKWSNTIAGAAVMTQAGSIGIAEGVYDKVYKDKLYTLDPTLQAKVTEAGNAAYNAINSQADGWLNIKSNDAEYAKMQAEAAVLTEYAKSNPELHLSAQESAAKGADTTLKINGASFLLNIFSQGLFLKGSLATRNVLNKPQAFGSKSDWLKEGLQEAVEEGVIENIAEKAGLSVGMGKNYGLSDAMNTVLSLEALESAAWGFAGGTLQTAATERTTLKNRTNQYEEQQKSIQKQNEIGKASGQPDMIDTVVSFSNNIQELSKLAQKQQELYDADLKEEGDAVGERIYHNQALHSFKTGTTQNLIDNYNKIATSKDLKPEVKARALEAIKDVETLEKIYNKSTKYLNSDSVYRNRANDFLLGKLKNEFQTKIVETKVRAGEVINSALEKGETSLKDYTTSPISNLPFSVDTLFKNTFTDRGQRDSYENFLNDITNDTTGYESVRQLRELQFRLENVNTEIEANNKKHDNFVSKTYQKSLLAETQLAKSFQEMKPLLVQEAGSDNYVKIVDSILSNYKSKIPANRLKYFRDEFIALNDAKKEEQNQVEKDAILKDANQTAQVTPDNTISKKPQANSVQRQSTANQLYNTSASAVKPKTKLQTLSTIDKNDDDNSILSSSIVESEIEDEISAKGHFSITKAKFESLSPDEQKQIKRKMKSVGNMRYTFEEHTSNGVDYMSVYDDRKIVLNPPSTEEGEQIESLEPHELADSISPETDKQIKEQVSDFYESLKSDLGSEPSFEEFVRDYMKHSSRQDADKYFNVLIRGWEANNYKKENYNNVYNSIFRNRKDIANTLSSLGEAITTGKEVVSTRPKLEKEVTEEIKAIEEKQTSPTFTSVNTVVYEHTGFTTHGVKSKFAYVIRLNEQTEELIEDEDAVSLGYEYTQDDLNKTAYVNSLKLLDPDKYLPGTKLQIQVPIDADNMLVPIHNEDGSKGEAMPFSKWVKQKMNELNLSLDEFKKTQEYKDKVPMVIVDSENEGVALVHDIGWYHPRRFMETQSGQIAEAINNTRHIREEVLKGNSEIVITEKRGGTYEPFKIAADKPTISIREANPDARIAVADKSGNLVSTETNNSSNVLQEGESFENTKEFSTGKTYDVRKTGENTYTAFPVFQRNIKEDIQESILMAIKLYANKYNNSLTTVEKTKNKELLLNFKNQTGYDLTSPRDLDAYIKNFIKLENVSASTYAEVHKKITSNENMPIGSPYLLTQKGAILFGLKGISLGQEEFMSLYPENLKEESGAELANHILQTFAEKVLPNYMQNVNITSLLLAEKPLMLLTKEGSIVTKSANYHDYLMDVLETNMKSVNIGTKESPLYVTKAQHVITYELTNNPTPKVNPVISVTNKPKTEKVVKPERQVVNIAPDKQLEQAVIKAEEENAFIFTGETITEKVEDLKSWVKDDKADDTEIKEFVDNYVNSEKEVKEALETIPQKQEDITPTKSITELFEEYNPEIDIPDNFKWTIDYTTGEVFFRREGDEDDYGLEEIKENKSYKDGNIKAINLYNELLRMQTEFDNLLITNGHKPFLQSNESKSEQTEDFTKLDEKVNFLLKQSESDLKWISEDEDLSYEPIELTDEQVKQALDDIDRIEGINANHQYYLVDYIYNRLSSSVGIDYGSKVDKEKITSEVKEIIRSLVNQNKDTYNSRVETLKSVYEQYPERYPQLKSIMDRYAKAISKCNTIFNNVDVLTKDATRKLFKFTGITETKNDDANAEEVDEDNEVEKNYSKTSLEENGKLSSSYRLKRFFSGIENVDKNGVPVTALLGVPTYVAFDSVFEVCQSILADTPADFNVMLEKLEQSTKSHGWLKSVIEKLKTADKMIQNEFVSTMTKHSLEMKFIMYSFDRKSGSYTLKVYNTNASAINLIIKKNWDNDLKQSNLVDSTQGQYEINKTVAQELLDEFNSWTRVPEISKATMIAHKLEKYIGKGEFTLAKPISEFNRGSIYTFYNKGNYSITKVSGKDNTYIIKPYEKSAMIEFLSKGKKATDTQKEEGIKVLSEWTANFGINLSQGTWEDLIENGMYHTYDGSRSTFQKLFDVSKDNNSAGVFGILAGKLNSYVSKDKGNLRLDEDNNYPLGDSAIEKDLVKLESRFTSNIVPNVFRDAGKAIFGFTPSKFITDRTQALKDSANPIVEQLRSLSFSSPSLWLKLLQEEQGFATKFDISHLGLNSIKEIGKKLYRDNDIVNLADADHELVKLGFFHHESGSSTTVINRGLPTEIKLRIAELFSPTMSDKTTMTTIKTAVLDLQSKHFSFSELTKDVKANNEVIDVLMEQLVLPELKRITTFHANIKSTNVKSYDNGAKLFLLLPALNQVKVEVSGQLVNIVKAMEVAPEKWNYQTVMDVCRDSFRKEVGTYLERLLAEKMKVWETNGYIVKDEKGNTTIKYLDSKYLDKFSNIEDVAIRAKVAAMDYIINQLIGNANSFMAFIGDPAIYYKAKPSDSFVKQSEDTFINVGKRLAAQIAPGNKLADSATNKYIQIFLGDNTTISENIEYLTELLDNKKFNVTEWNKIQSLTDDKERKLQTNNFLSQYPNTADYFDIESTDAQEYTTWKEHLYILEKMGKTPDVALDITPEEIREAREMFANNIPLESFTEKQKAVYKKVLQPIKPVYTGQVYDKAQDLMRVVYIKTSSFPLIPQVTQGLELDRLRVAMETLEKQSGKTVRASYQSGNKVGAMAKPVSLFKKEGGFKDVTVENLKASSLELNRDNFRIQQDVPFKSAKRNEDTVTLGTQTLKLLFGNGVMELNGFDYNDTKKTGKELYEIYNSSFMELINFKRDEFFEEIGVDRNGTPINVKDTIKKLQKVLKTEAEGRGYPKQDIEALGIEHEEINGKIVNVKFTLPIWLAANSNRYEALLNAIITNRIAKIKMPGNSYPVGSQEGFEFRNDLKDIDKSKIVYTSKWTGKLKAANIDKQGNFLTAQVLAPSKFRDNEGNLIDLFEKVGEDYKYITKTEAGFRIKEDMFDSNLFSLNSFRIPTSGHVSMAQIEIVGFLPYEVGDLMIVPKNFTKQKGLDFDIDKENTYQFWHTQNENGKFVKIDSQYSLKEVNEKIISEPTNPLWKKLKIKLLQNKIVEVHKAVMTNPSRDMQKKINAILSIDFAKNQADKIDGWIQGNKDNSYFTPLSDEYQKAKMGLGAAGKIGIGAYSIDVVFNSLAEQQRALGKPLRLMEVNPAGDSVPKQFTFDSYTSNGELGNSKTFDGDRNISQVMAECQNIATDNEKEQVMGRVNLNSHTLDVHKVFNLLGFDKGRDGNSIALMFLSQPVLREFVKELSNASSNIAEFVPDKEARIVEKLTKQYLGRDLNFTELEIYANQFNNDKFSAEIQSSKPDPLFQIAVLYKFLEMKEYGVALRAVQQTLNIDSKGLGKSTYDSIEKIAALERLASNKAISGASDLLGDFVESRTLTNSEKQSMIDKGYIEFPNYLIKPTTIAGAFSTYALNASQVWDSYLPYASKEFAEIYDEVFTSMGKSEISGSAATEKKQHILKEMKKYLYSNPILFRGNPQTERARLFFDNENNASLAKYLQQIFSTEIPIIKSNKLINRFQYELNSNGDISKIIFNNSQGENFDEEYLYNALLELAEKPIDLPDYNGKSYNSRKLAQDLVMYSFLEGGVQEAVQFTKYIPISLLKVNGFTKALQKAHEDIINNRNNVFGKDNRRDEDNTHFISRFTMQYAQHNPERYTKVDEKTLLELKGNVYSSKDKKIENLISFPNPLKNNPNFISVYNKNIPVGKKFQLYYWDGNKYTRVPVLGTFGMAEYDAKNNLYDSLLGAEIETKPVLPTTEAKVQPKVERVEIAQLTLTQAIDRIINSQSPEFKEISALAKAVKPYLKNTTKFEIKELKSRGAYSQSLDTIFIDSKWLQEGAPLDVARTILKEFVHSITQNELLKYSDALGNLKIQNAPQYITRLIRLFKEVEKHFGKELEVLRAKDIKEGVTSKEKTLVYGGYNLLEFVEMIMTQPEFQKEMDNVKYASTDETLWTRFLKIIGDILSSLGIDFKKEGITANAISSVFELLETEQNLDKSKEFSNFEETKIDMQTENLMKAVDKVVNLQEVIIDGTTYSITEDKKLIDNKGNEVTDILIKNKVLLKLANEKGILTVVNFGSAKFGVLPDGRIFVISSPTTLAGTQIKQGETDITGYSYEDIAKKAQEMKDVKLASLNQLTNILSLRKQQIEYTTDQEDALNKVANFIQSKDRFFLLAGYAGTGKAQPLTSKVYTPKGYKLMGELQIGDYVFGEDGKKKPILGIYPQGIKDVYKITFSDGSSVECCGEHLWKVFTYDDRNRQRAYLNKSKKVKEYSSILTTLEMKDSIYHTRKDGSKDLNFKVPVTKAVEFEKQNLPINPYLLGVLIGDGGLANGSVRFTNIDSHILHKVEEIVNQDYNKFGLSFKQVSDTITYSVSGNKGNSSNQLLNEIRKLNLDVTSDLKFLPSSYKYSSIDDRIALLQGLMDTDGTVDKRGKHTYYSTVSPKLKDDVVELIQSLGCIASVGFKKNDFKGCYNITINQSNEFDIFSLPRKQKLVIAKTKYKLGKYITNIELIGEVEQQCIYIDSESHLYLTDGFAVTHNTTIAENIVKFTLQNRKGSEVLAPTNKAASRLREKLNGTGTNVEASTIHKAMYGEPNPVTGEFEGGALQNNTVYIIDESSMITKTVLEDLKQQLPANSKIIFVGDGFQLEPVGKNEDPKLFEADTINELFGDNFSQLSEVKRQEGDILAVATTMRITQEANVPSESTDDFIIAKNKNEIVESFKESIRNNEEAVFVVPINKDRIELNKIAREVKFGKNSKLIEPGESVIGIANSNNISNSEVNTISRILEQTEPFEMEINFGSKMYPNVSKVTFTLAKVMMPVDGISREMVVLLSPNIDKPSVYHAQISQSFLEGRQGTSILTPYMVTDKKGKTKLTTEVSILTYAYSITAHKSQGSEWNTVFVSPSWIHEDTNSVRWIYTAITRAKKKVHFLPSKYTQPMRMSTIEAIAKNKDYNTNPTAEDIANAETIETLDPNEIVQQLTNKGLITEYCK